MALRITITPEGTGDAFRDNFAGLSDRWQAALSASVNMAASMIKERGDADIASAGAFGQRWQDQLSVATSTTKDNMEISMTLRDPAAIFETGGTIQGRPLLWIPFSDSDAEGTEAGDYPGGLFSVQSKSGRPLLFSVSDKLPKYFGIEAVTMPKLFHIREIMQSVMGNFRQIFESQFGAG